jgi:hypothetical protein
MSKPNVFNSILNEKVNYGGLLATRKQVYDDLLPRFGDKMSGYCAFILLKRIEAMADCN